MGYDNRALVSSILNKTKRYSPAPALWPDLGAPSTVLDFGGSFGEAYHRAKHIVPNVHWAIIETPAFVARASEIETPYLRMFPSIFNAIKWLPKPDLLHSNGALQYTNYPLSYLNTLLAFNIPTILWYRTELTHRAYSETLTQTSRLRHNGPGKSPWYSGWRKVRYEKTLLPRADFYNAHLRQGYSLTNPSPNTYIARL